MAALAPIPSARVNTTVIANPLERASDLSATLRSRRNNSGLIIFQSPYHSEPRFLPSRRSYGTKCFGTIYGPSVKPFHITKLPLKGIFVRRRAIQRRHRHV